MTDLLSIKEAAPKLGVKPDTLRRLCVQKKIKHLRVGPSGGLYKLTQEFIDEYLNSCVVETSTSKAKPVNRSSKSSPVRRATEKTCRDEAKEFQRRLKEMRTE